MVYLNKIANKMLFLLLATILNSNAYAMAPDPEESQDHFSRLPPELAQHIFSFVSPQKKGQTLSLVDPQSKEKRSSVNLWEYLCKSEGWAPRVLGDDDHWKRYFKFEYKRKLDRLQREKEFQNSRNSVLCWISNFII